MRPAFAALRGMASGRGWPIVAVASAAWVMVIAVDHSVLTADFCLTSAVYWPADVSALLAATAINASPLLVQSWVTMLLAMMMPLLYQPLFHVWDNSLTQRRVRAIVLFLAGYFVVWLVAMAVLALFAAVLRVATGGAVASFLVAVGIATSWQMTKLKTVALTRCHRITPLLAFGFAAELASLRYGVHIAGYCVGTCWGIMLLPLAGGTAHLAIMAASSLWMLSERYSVRRRSGPVVWVREGGFFARPRWASWS